MSLLLRRGKSFSSLHSNKDKAKTHISFILFLSLSLLLSLSAFLSFTNSLSLSVYRSF
jgi:hypothetical protein